MSSFTASSPTYYLATNGQTVFHTGFIDNGIILSTGQPTLETFSTFNALNAALVALGQPELANDPAIPS